MTDGKGLHIGLLGEHLGHSYSPQIHREIASYDYRLIELPREAVGSFLRDGDYDALNVTIPYKKEVMPYLDAISDEAARIGSVNTILRRGNRLIGENTDYSGFSYLLDKSGIAVDGKKVLILGSGGASMTARTVCADRGGKVVIISRKGEDNYENLDRHADADVIVNTTPVGMYPNNGTAPLDLSLFPRLCGVIDMIYNPARTRLLLDAKALGIPCANGLPMLVAQAVRAAELFLDHPLPCGEIERVEKAIARETSNLILIGMPGAGKTTIGKKLAEALGRKFFDTDTIIEEKTGRKIPEILNSDGEKVFREIESGVAEETGKLTGAVIATGGGVPLSAGNRDALRQNGYILYLRRDLDKLPTKGRPLSMQISPEVLFREREPIYRSLCDLEIDNRGTPEETLRSILSAMEGNK